MKGFNRKHAVGSEFEKKMISHSVAIGRGFFSDEIEERQNWIK